MSFNLKKDTCIYVAGHKGMIGSAFIRFFYKNGYENIVTRDRENLDLTSEKDVLSFFQEINPEVVILSAGKVGGIMQNKEYPADFISENLSLQLNIFNAARKYNVKKLVFFASSCMYPRNAAQPMSENLLCTGHPEPTSIAYASAKYAGVQMCQAINRQSDSTSFISIIPNSVYGPNDNFDLNSSHVLSALIRRFHEAKESGNSTVELWGTGTPRREFIFVDDVVRACIDLLSAQLRIEDLPINLGIGSDITIKELSGEVASIVGYSGEIIWDTSKPDGTPRKLLDNSRVERLIDWKPEVDLNSGLKLAYQWYVDSIA